MILDMIQDCRYSRRSTDRWTLSKNSTTRQMDSRVWRKAGLYWRMIVFFTYIQGSYLYPAKYNLEWIRCLTYLQAWSPIHPFVLPAWTTSPSNPAKSALLFLCRTEADSRPQISLPNISEKNLPSARRTPHRARPTSQTPYQILVLTIGTHQN
jgi:hypothetical protein